VTQNQYTGDQDTECEQNKEEQAENERRYKWAITGGQRIGLKQYVHW